MHRLVSFSVLSPAAARSAVFALSSALGLLACGGDSGAGPESPRTRSVSVAPSTMALAVGETRTLVATVTGGSGTVTWTSSSPAVAAVDGAGVVTAWSVGEATITASLVGEAGVRATVAVSVGPNVRAVRVEPVTFSLQYGDTLRLTPTVEDLAGAVVTDREVTWRSSAPGVATVSDDGLVTGTGGGVVTVTASVQGVVGESTGAVQSFRLAENVTVVDSTTLALVSTSSEQAAGTYRFEWRGPGPAPDLDIDDILVGAQGLGFLRRVTAASTQGDQITVQSEPAVFDDVVAEGEFAFEVPLFEGTSLFAAPPAFDSPERARYGATWVRAAPGVALSSSQSAGFGINFDGFDVCKFFKNTDPSNACPSVIDEFKFKKANVTFSPSFDFGSTKDSQGNFTEFHGIATGQFGADLLLSLGAKVQTQYKAQATIIEFGRIVYLQVGALPVVVHAEMEIKATFEAKATVKGKLVGGVATSHSVDVGARWGAQQGWQGVLTGNGNFNPYQPSVGDSTVLSSITLEAKLSLAPNLNLKFYGVAGPLLGLDEYAKAAMVASTTACNFDASVGIDGKIGIALADFLSKALNNPNFTDSKTLATAPLATWQCPVGDADVVVQTTGADPDPDGYQIEVAGQSEGAIGTAETRFFGNLREGDREFALKGLSDNCAVVGDNPTNASIQVGSKTTVRFDVECRDTSGGTGGGGGGGGGGGLGAVRVDVATSGGLPDPDGYQLTVDGKSRAAGTTDQVTFAALPPGTYSVAISGVAPHCASAPTSQQVTVAAGGTEVVSFAVTCAGGQIDVSTTVTGTPPAHALLGLELDGSSKGPVDFNTTTTLFVPAGTYDVTLTDVPAVCTLSGQPTVQATVTDQGTAPVGFLLDCPSGRLTATVSTQGDPGSATSFRIVVDGQTTRSVPATGGSASFGGVSDGDHAIELLDVAEPCTVEGQNPRMVTVPGSVNFSVVCSGPGGDIAFARGFDLWRMNADGTLAGLQFVSPDLPGIADFVKWPSWSPDGSRMVFSKGWYGGLWIIGEDSDTPVQLTPFGNGKDTHPDWSGFGFIAFSRDVAGLDPAMPNLVFTSIHAIDPSSGSVRRVTGSDVRFAMQPSVSPDGSTIVFAGMQRQGGTATVDLFSVSTAGGSATRLTRMAADREARSPSYSPDGRAIAYVEGIYSQPTRGSGNHLSSSIRLLSGGSDQVLVSGLEGLPDRIRITWSPDGQRLMFNAGPQINGVGASTIFIVNVDGTGLVEVGPGHDPDWRH